MTFLNKTEFQTYVPVLRAGVDPDDQSSVFELQESVNFTSYGFAQLEDTVFDDSERTIRNRLGPENPLYLKYLHPSLQSEYSDKNEIYRDIILDKRQDDFMQKHGFLSAGNDLSRGALVDNALAIHKELRTKYPNVKEFKSLPINRKELEAATEVEAQSITLEVERLKAHGLDKGSAFLGGVLLAQIKDPINLAAMAIPFGSAKASYTGMKFLFDLGWKGAATVSVAEFLQTTRARKRAEKMGINIDNPHLQQRLSNMGVDLDSLVPDKEVLNKRLMWAAAAGFLLTPIVGGAGRLLGKYLRGERWAKDILEHETSKLVEIGKNLPTPLTPKTYMIHLEKFIKKIQDEKVARGTESGTVSPRRKVAYPIYRGKDAIQKVRKGLTKRAQKIATTFVGKIPPKEVNKMIKETEKIFNIKLTTMQKKRLAFAIELDDFNIRLHNRNLMLSHVGKNGVYKPFFKFGDTGITPEIVIQARNIFNLERLELKETQAKVVQEWIEAHGLGFTSNLKGYTKELSKITDPEIRRLRLLNDYARIQALDGLLQAHKINPNTPFDKLVSDMLEPSFGRGVGFHNDVFSAQSVIQTEMIQLLELHTKKFLDLNFRDSGKGIEEFLEKAIIELFGESTGDPLAKEFAKNLSKMFGYSRDLLNAHGLNIGKLTNYFPMLHNIDKISQKGPREWAEYIIEHLDLEKTARNLGLVKGSEAVTNVSSLRQPVMEALEAMHKNIELADIVGTVNTFTRKGKLSADAAVEFHTHAKHRYLIFKDAKHWMEYQKAFGEGIYTSLTSYMRNASKTAALLQVFGPNVSQNFDDIVTLAIELEAKTVGTRARTGIKKLVPKKWRWNTTKGAYTAKLMFNHVMGKEFAPPSSNHKMIAKIGTELRASVIVSKLGAAFLASLADFSYGGMTRSINGMPINKAVGNYIKMFRGNEQQARAAQVVADMLIDDIRAGARIHGELTGTGPFSRLSNSLMKWSGLEPGTLAARKAFRYEFQQHLGRIAAGGIETLSKRQQKAFREQMKHYKVTDADLVDMKSLKLASDLNDPKVKYLVLANIEDEVLKLKLSRWMSMESLAAVPTLTIRSRSLMMGGTLPGTPWGEAARHVMLFKNFPIPVMATHLNRAFFGLKDRSMQAQYIAGLTASTTLLGTAIYQFKRITQGKDPLPMNVGTLTKGFVLGGAGGLFADVIGKDTSYYGASPWDIIVPPATSMVTDLSKFTFIPFVNSLYDEDLSFSKAYDKLPANMLRFIDRNAPFTNLWYTRLAKDRLVMDSLYNFMDADINRKRALYRTREKKAGSSYFWRPGKKSPDRFPKLNF